jgi:hypothetical protein
MKQSILLISATAMAGLTFGQTTNVISYTFNGAGTLPLTPRTVPTRYLFTAPFPISNGVHKGKTNFVYDIGPNEQHVIKWAISGTNCYVSTIRHK